MLLLGSWFCKGKHSRTPPVHMKNTIERKKTPWNEWEEKKYINKIINYWHSTQKYTQIKEAKEERKKAFLIILRSETKSNNDNTLAVEATEQAKRNEERREHAEQRFHTVKWLFSLFSSSSLLFLFAARIEMFQLETISAFFFFSPLVYVIFHELLFLCMLPFSKTLWNELHVFFFRKRRIFLVWKPAIPHASYICTKTCVTWL